MTIFEAIMMAFTGSSFLVNCVRLVLDIVKDMKK